MLGIAQQTTRLQAEAEMMRQRERLQRAHATLGLREKALRGEIKADEVAAEQRLMEQSLRHDLVQQQLKIARNRVQEVSRRRSRHDVAGRPQTR